MKENGKLLRFVYHNGELLHEEGDKEESSYHLGLGIEAIQRNQRLHYYHRDEQLSTVLMTDGNGEIQNQYHYDAFGNILESAEKFSNRIRYTGQQYDQVTEQYYLRARYYTPALGRFLHEDVYQGDGLNLYAYCGNNPVVYYDPSGHKKDEDRLEFVHYDLLCIYAKTRKNVDIDLVEAKLQEQYELAMKVKEASEKEKKKK